MSVLFCTEVFVKTAHCMYGVQAATLGSWAAHPTVYFGPARSSCCPDRLGALFGVDEEEAVEIAWRLGAEVIAETADEAARQRPQCAAVCHQVTGKKYQ